jgi:hypothetical protein
MSAVDADTAWRIGLYRQLNDLTTHRAWLLAQVDATHNEIRRVEGLIREANQ